MGFYGETFRHSTATELVSILTVEMYLPASLFWQSSVSTASSQTFAWANVRITYGSSIGDRLPEIEALASYWQWQEEVYPGAPSTLAGDFNLPPPSRGLGATTRGRCYTCYYERCYYVRSLRRSVEQPLRQHLENIRATGSDISWHRTVSETD